MQSINNNYQNYRYIKFFYLGTNYHGIQRQPNLPTVENSLIKALQDSGYIPPEGDLQKPPLLLAGRTDKGVHARGMVAAFLNKKENFYPMEVNKNLPRDIIIWADAEIPNFGFQYYKPSIKTNQKEIDIISRVPHPRHNAIYRKYKYFLFTQGELDIEAMKAGAAKLIGKHDFSNLCKNEPGRNPIRKLDSIKITSPKSIGEFGTLWEFEFTALSFLWKQIRKTIRVLFNIGMREWDLDTLDSILDPKNIEWRIKLQPMPPEFLVLWDVVYPEWVKFKTSKQALKLVSERILKKISTMYVIEQIEKSLKTEKC